MKRTWLVSTLTVLTLTGATVAIAAAPAANAADPSSYLIRAGAPFNTVQQQGETFFTSDFYLTTSGTGSDITISGSSDGTAIFKVDDIAHLTITHPDGSVSTQTFDQHGGCGGLVPSNPTMLTDDFAPGVNEVHVTFADICGGVEGSSDVWLTGNLAVSTTPPNPTLGVSLSDNSGGTARNGQLVAYTAKPSVSTFAESQPITLTDTFPAALVPQSLGLVGLGWNCGASGQTVTCTLPANLPIPIGAVPSVVMPVEVNVPAGSQPVSTDDSVSVSSPDAATATADDQQTYNGPAATGLSFLSQPVDSQVNSTVTRPDGSTDIKVGAVTSAGPVDPTYNGPITLGFGNNPGKAQFLVGGQPTPTITLQATQGVADFTPIIVNAVGFGYTLTASTAGAGVGPATSSSFDVANGASSCQANQTCTTTATSPPGTGVSAVVTGLAAGNTTTLTASFGGNVAPIHPCNTPIAGVLTFNGARQKVVNFTVQTNRPILIFCYGQPTPFVDLTLRKTTFFNTVNNEYEGVLGPCLGRLIPPPCISGLSLSRTSETVTVTGGPDDPRMSH